MQDMARDRDGRLVLWAAIAVAGAIAAIVGVFLPWAERSVMAVNPDGTFDVTGLFVPEEFAGISHWTGIVAFVAALAAMGGAAGALFLRSDGGRRLAAIVAVAAGVVVVAAAITGYFLEDSIASGTLLENEFAGFEHRYGVYVTGIGGLVAIVGSLLMLPRLARARRHVPVPAPAPA